MEFPIFEIPIVEFPTIEISGRYWGGDTPPHTPPVGPSLCTTLEN